MAYSSFMKLCDPVKKGESQDKIYKGSDGWFEIYSFSWGASNPTSIQSGKGAASGRVSISSFNVMKKTDVASAELFQQCCLGKHFNTAEVVLTKASGSETPIEFIKYSFEEVFVESIQWSGSAGGDDTPTESISFAFGKVNFTYKEQGGTGAEDETQIGSWDLRLNAKG